MDTVPVVVLGTQWAAAKTAVTAMNPSGQQVPSLLDAWDGDSGLQ